MREEIQLVIMRSTFTGFFEVNDINSIEKENSILLLGIPFERIKATKGGSKKAPDALRKQSIEFSGISTDFNINNAEINCYDLGNIHPIKNKNYIIEIWKKIRENNSKLIVLGGDHSITYDTLVNAPWDDKTALVWIDSHADLADEYPPGIFQSHGTVFTNLKKELELEKNQMLFIGGHGYTLTTTEFEKIQRGDTTNYISTQKLLENKLKYLDEIKQFVSKFDKIYLSIDSDAVDQVFIPTVATMEPFGITPSILADLLNMLLPKAIYVDLVEIKFLRRNKLALNFGVGLIYRILEIWSSKA